MKHDKYYGTKEVGYINARLFKNIIYKSNVLDQYTLRDEP